MPLVSEARETGCSLVRSWAHRIGFGRLSLKAHWLWVIALCLHQPVLATAWRFDRIERAQGMHAEVVHAEPRWEEVGLPDVWRLQQRSGTWTYRLRVPTCAPETTGACLDGKLGGALWVPRVGRQVSLWVNGRLVARSAELEGYHMGHIARPLLVFIPPVHLRLNTPREETNDLRLVVSTPKGRTGGLARVWIGPEADLVSRHDWRDVFVVGSSSATMSTALSLSLAGLFFALRTRAVEAWLFFIDSFLWGAREALWLMSFRHVPWELAMTLGALANGAAMLVAGLLLLRLLSERGRLWPSAALIALALLPGLIWWRTQDAHADTALTWWYLASHALGVWVTAIAIVAVWRKPSWPRALILAGCVGVAGLAWLENWHKHLSPDPLSFEQLRLAPFLSLCALLAVCVSVYVRVSTAFAIEANHKESMRREIESQRRELEQWHEHAREQARSEAVAQERARFVRDMHDGLGSQLVGMLSTVESGTFTRDELLDGLSEALQELRLTIDSLEPIGDDLASLLGQLRFRLDARLRKAGFEVIWDVGVLPTGVELTAHHVDHLQRLLYEVFSNVIKHSCAKHVWVQAHHDHETGTHLIVVRDDGRGFDMTLPGGRGLRNLSYRAMQLGARLELFSQPGQGTQVSLHWQPTGADQASE